MKNSEKTARLGLAWILLLLVSALTNLWATSDDNAAKNTGHDDAIAIANANDGTRAANAAAQDVVTPQQTVTVTVSPAVAGVTVTTQTQQFTASQPSVTWSVNGIVGGNAATVGTISSTGLYTPSAVPGTYKITATTGTSSGSATVGVTDLQAVLTYHVDPARDGVNPKEYVLSPTSVATATFGKLFSCSVDGPVSAEPLWIHALTIAGAVHNVIFVATQNDSVYAFDADASPCVTYWQANLLDTLHGGVANETPVVWNDVGGCNGDVYPEIGVTGTPVIDSTTKTLYVVSASESNVTTHGNCKNTVGTFTHRLHALDLTSGSEKFNAPVTIAASVPGTGDGSSNGIVSFLAHNQLQRSGLVQVAGKIFVSFASHEDATPYHGWLIGYRAANVQQQIAVFMSTPNGVNGADGGMWIGGGAPAVDAGGDLYVATGNGVFDEDTSSPESDYGDSVVRLHAITGSTSNGSSLSVAGYFTPYDQAKLAADDDDLGSGAPVLFPAQTGSGPVNLLVQMGKEGILYLIDRDNMGEYNPVNNSQIVQSFRGSVNGLWGTPVLWRNNLYINGQRDYLKQYTFNPSTELFTETITSETTQLFGYPGPQLSLSAQAANHAILWAVDSTAYGYSNWNLSGCAASPLPAGCAGPTVLHAYNPANLANEYWNSTMAANNRDQAGNAVKFATPTVANGKVYVGTMTEVDVYGVLN
jgi:hypothetical protein